MSGFNSENAPRAVRSGGPQGPDTDLRRLQNPNLIMVNVRQKGNPILKYIRNVGWNFEKIEPDFILGQTTCALYLSMKYHRLHPEYIYTRLRELDHKFDVRVLLLMVDVPDHKETLKELTKAAILKNFTLILAWSVEEAARYLETYKAYENKGPDLLMERSETDYLSRMTEAMTSVRSVNKTDVISLISVKDSFLDCVDSPVAELNQIPGIGMLKARRIYDVFHTPFIREDSLSAEGTREDHGGDVTESTALGEDIIQDNGGDDII
eukprot:Clim_evm113s172 gene=Clim_evmTU113s172